MNTDRQRLKDRIMRDRGRFPAWNEDMLELCPQTLARMHEFIMAAEAGNRISEKLRHLIWIAADAVVSHLYPRGIGIHAREAMRLGASPQELVETLEIACVITCRTPQVALEIVLDEMARRPGEPKLRSEVPAQAADGARPAWMEIGMRYFPDYVRALSDFVDPPEAEHALDRRSRELIFFAVHACPAVVDPVGMRRHARRALECGASGEDLLDVIKLASCIGNHALAVGMPAIIEQLKEKS